MSTPQQTLKDIKRLLASFPPVNGDPALVLHNYLTAAAGFAPDFLTDGVDLIIKGELPGHDGRFAPTPPMLATACRLAAEKNARQRYLNGIKAPRLPAPDIKKTDAERERVREMAKHAAETIGAVNLDTSEAEMAASKARWERVNAYFQPPQDDASLTDRLNLNRDRQGYSIGAPESEENAA